MPEAKKEEVVIPSREELLEGGGDEGKQQQEEKAPEYTATEVKAMEQGWKPKDKWDGDPEQHRSAREYLDRGELLGKIKSQSAQLDELKRAVVGMTEHNKKVYASGYENAIKDLKSQKLAALEAGDARAVMDLDDKIDEHKEAIRAIKAQPAAVSNQPSLTTQQWLADNKWYAEDRAARIVADALAVEFYKSNPGASEEQIYSHIDREIKKELPEKFARKSAPDPDGAGRQATKGGNKSSGGFEKLLESMDEDQARIARTLVKTGAITKEKYVEDYKAMFGETR